MSRKEKLLRYGLFVIGLFFIALGIAFTVRANLGISPISSVPKVMSEKFSSLTFGTWAFIWNCVFLSGQILILRKKFKLIQMLQLPLSVLFGIFSDLGLEIVKLIPNSSYILKFVLLIIGVMVLGFGVTLSVKANIILNAPEAFAKVVADTTQKQFSTMKVAMDVTCVIISAALSFLFFQKLGAIGIGTIITALLVGTSVKMYLFIFKKLNILNI